MEDVAILQSIRIGLEEAAGVIRRLDESLEKQFKASRANPALVPMWRDTALSACRTMTFEIADSLRFSVDIAERLAAAGWEMDTAEEPGSAG